MKHSIQWWKEKKYVPWIKSVNCRKIKLVNNEKVMAVAYIFLHFDSSLRKLFS